MEVAEAAPSEEAPGAEPAKKTRAAAQAKVRLGLVWPCGDLFVCVCPLPNIVLGLGSQPHPDAWGDLPFSKSPHPAALCPVLARSVFAHVTPHPLAVFSGKQHHSR